MRKKILLKVWDDWSGQVKVWTHLCYINPSVYELLPVEYRESDQLKELLIKWAEKDFGIHVKLDTINAVYLYRQHIKNNFSMKLAGEDFHGPYVQGIVSAWVEQHIEKEFSNES